MNVGATDAFFEMTPEAFNAVHVKLAPDIFFRVMVHDFVPVGAILSERAISNALICADRAAALNIGENNRRKRCLVGVPHRPGPQGAFPLQHAEHDRLSARSVTATDPASLALLLATDERLVDFHVTRERPCVVGICHVLAYFMRHAPRGLVGAAELAFQFLRRDAVPGRGHQIHGKEPVGERRARLLKWSTDTRINVVAAILAGVRAAFRDPMISGFNTASRTDDGRSAVLNFHDLVQARRVGRVLGLELFEGVLAHRAKLPCSLGIV